MSAPQVGASTTYCCLRAPAEPPVDGTLDGPVWRAAERSPRFGDMVNGAPGLYDTRAALLWDDEALYVAFWVEEPFVRAEANARDDLVFLENDIEVLIDGGDCYYEFELNAAGVIYEVFFIWQGFGVLAGERSIPPREGDVWRIFLGRFQKLVLSGVEVQPHPAWTWTPHGTYDTHLPERWLEVCFSDVMVEIPRS